MLPQIVLGERALRQLSYRTFASVAPTMPPSAESMVTRTPSTPGAGPAESAENFSRREEAKLSFAAPSVAFESCETGWTVYIFTSFPLNGSHLPEKMLVSSRHTLCGKPPASRLQASRWAILTAKRHCVAWIYSPKQSGSRQESCLESIYNPAEIHLQYLPDAVLLAVIATRPQQAALQS